MEKNSRAARELRWAATCWRRAPWTNAAPCFWTGKAIYHSNCPLDQRWLNFAEIHYGDFRSQVASGATDDEIAAWIEKNAKKRPRAEIVAWNNKERDLRLSDLPPELQEYMENYIQRYVPRNRVVYHWFDVYDLEEQRI